MVGAVVGAGEGCGGTGGANVQVAAEGPGGRWDGDRDPNKTRILATTGSRTSPERRFLWVLFGSRA